MTQSTNQVMPPPSSEAAQASLRQCFQTALAAPGPTSGPSPQLKGRSEEPTQYSLADPFAGINPPPPEILKESCPMSQSSWGRTATRSEPPRANTLRMKRKGGAVPTPKGKRTQSVAIPVALNPPGTFPISEVDTLTRPLLSQPSNQRPQKLQQNSSR